MSKKISFVRKASPMTFFVLVGLAIGFLVYQPEEPVLSNVVIGNIKGLRDVTDNYGIRVGVALGHDDILQPIYHNTVPSEFDSLTPENLMKFGELHPCPPTWLIASNSSIATWVANNNPPDCTNPKNEYDWIKADALVNWAMANDMGVRVHTLLWHNQNPTWLTSENVTLSATEREQIMEGHIRDVISHYCSFADNIYAYDVVNEAIVSDGTPNGTLRDSPWKSVPDYIRKAFQIARDELDAPSCLHGDAKLYYNDFGIEYDRHDLYGDDYGKGEAGFQAIPSGYTKAQSIYQYFDNIINSPNPAPIDGIGFQTHLQLYPTNPLPHDTDDMVNTMNWFSTGLGLEISITELDVQIRNAANRPDWYDEQATQFRGVAEACVLAMNCVSFTTWGVHDGESWRFWEHPLMFYDMDTSIYDPAVGQCISSPSPLPIDAQHCPKPAYYAVYYFFKKTHLPLIINDAPVNLISPTPAIGYPGPGQSSYPGP